MSNYATAQAALKVVQGAGIIDLTEDEFDYLVGDKLWLPIDRSRSRRCIEAAVYGTLDYLGYPRFAPPVEFVAATIAQFVHPVNVLTACQIMEGGEFCDNIINGIESPARAAQIFSHVLKLRAKDYTHLSVSEERAAVTLKALQ